MSESEHEAQTGISDDLLPDDLVGGEDNPLAEPLQDGESPGDLLEDGRPATESQDSDASEDTPGTDEAPSA